jgi:hypothetical protein
MSKSKTRRNLLRIAKRKSITYNQAIEKFYRVGDVSELDNNLLWSLRKRKSKARDEV